MKTDQKLNLMKDLLNFMNERKSVAPTGLSLVIWSSHATILSPLRGWLQSGKNSLNSKKTFVVNMKSRVVQIKDLN